MRTDLNFYHERGWAKRAVQKQMWPCLILESVCDQQVRFLQIVSVILLASNHCIQSGHGTKKASQHRVLSTANHNQAAVTPRVQFLKRGSSLFFLLSWFLKCHHPVGESGKAPNASLPCLQKGEDLENMSYGDCVRLYCCTF